MLMPSLSVLTVIADVSTATDAAVGCASLFLQPAHCTSPAASGIASARPHDIQLFPTGFTTNASSRRSPSPTTGECPPPFCARDGDQRQAQNAPLTRHLYQHVRVSLNSGGSFYRH